MNILLQSICVFVLGLPLVTHAALPDQNDVFTIAVFGGRKQNYVSQDFIYSALGSYDEIDGDDYAMNAPWSKNAYTEQGVIVLNDKTVLFFDTQSSQYLTIVDSSNKSTYYRLTKKIMHRHVCPKYAQTLNGLPFPKAEDVFCIATFPWNHDEHFSPETLLAALPHFRPIVKEDVPENAVQCSTGNPKDALVYYPKEWEQVQHSNSAGALNGVIVLANKAVFKWITWTPTAVTFGNYRVNTYFMLTR